MRVVRPILMTAFRCFFYIALGVVAHQAHEFCSVFPVKVLAHRYVHQGLQSLRVEIVVFALQIETELILLIIKLLQELEFLRPHCLALGTVYLWFLSMPANVGPVFEHVLVRVGVEECAQKLFYVVCIQLPGRALH